jgi:hypothetical protein
MQKHRGLAACAAIVAGMIATTQLTVSAATFPTDANGAYKASIIRHFDSTGTFTTAIAGYNPNGYSQEQGGTAGTIDGAYRYNQWDIGSVNPLATAGFDITLDTIYSIKEFNTKYGGFLPTNGYQISVSTTGFGALTPAVTSGSTPAANQTDVLATPVQARYIRYTWTGASNYIQVQEFHAYADAATNAFPIATDGGFDILATGYAATHTTDLTPGKWIDSPNAATDVNENTYLRGAGTGDAIFKTDLGQVDKLVAASLGFYPSQPWTSGAKIEVSPDDVTYTTVFDTHSSVDTQNIPFATPTLGRYVRVTNYGGSGDAMSDLQVFGAPVPEPAALGLLGLAALLLRRRK